MANKTIEIKNLPKKSNNKSDKGLIEKMNNKVNLNEVNNITPAKIYFGPDANVIDEDVDKVLNNIKTAKEESIERKRQALKKAIVDGINSGLFNSDLDFSPKGVSVEPAYTNLATKDKTNRIKELNTYVPEKEREREENAKKNMLKLINKPSLSTGTSLPKEVIINETDSNDKYEYVNHPSHYNSSSIETIEKMRKIWGDENTALWCEMTAFKYRDRIGNKPDNSLEQEAAKIKWYESKAKELRNL